VSFNYTRLYGTHLDASSVCHFHGSLGAYLRVDDRVVVSEEAGLQATTIDGIVDLFGRLRLDVAVDGAPDAIDLPALVPPLTFKPVMSRDQLHTWSRVDDALRKAPVIVVAGYSFAQVDEHFNDLLRKADQEPRVIVLNPDLGGTARRIARILGIDPATMKKTTIAGHRALRQGQLTCVGCKAEELRLAQFRQLI